VTFYQRELKQTDVKVQFEEKQVPHQQLIPRPPGHLQLLHLCLLALSLSLSLLPSSLFALQLDVTLELPDGSSFVFDAELCDAIVPDQCKIAINRANVEIKLKKARSGQWATLEAKPGAVVNPWPDTSSTATTTTPPPPPSSIPLRAPSLSLSLPSADLELC
jgi:hypothetical protein